MTGLRPASPDEYPALTELCLSSKAHWGYDPAFLEACRPAFTFTENDLRNTWLRVPPENGNLIAVVQVGEEAGEPHLLKLFIAPPAMGRGCGRTLMNAAISAACDMGFDHLVIEADPGAAPFYIHMGAEPAGEAPSEAIPGRMLPRLILPLDPSRPSR